MLDHEKRLGIKDAEHCHEPRVDTVTWLLNENPRVNKESRPARQWKWDRRKACSNSWKWARGWFSSCPNNTVIVQIIFGTHLLEEPPQSLSFTGRVRKQYGNKITAPSVGCRQTWRKPLLCCLLKLRPIHLAYTAVICKIQKIRVPPFRKFCEDEWENRESTENAQYLQNWVVCTHNC